MALWAEEGKGIGGGSSSRLSSSVSASGSSMGGSFGVDEEGDQDQLGSEGIDYLRSTLS
jgi:formiminotetrahydrofolate cyclodeaminase